MAVLTMAVLHMGQRLFFFLTATRHCWHSTRWLHGDKSTERSPSMHTTQRMSSSAMMGPRGPWAHWMMGTPGMLRIGMTLYEGAIAADDDDGAVAADEAAVTSWMRDGARTIGTPASTCGGTIPLAALVAVTVTGRTDTNCGGPVTPMLLLGPCVAEATMGGKVDGKGLERPAAGAPTDVTTGAG